MTFNFLLAHQINWLAILILPGCVELKNKSPSHQDIHGFKNEFCKAHSETITAPSVTIHVLDIRGSPTLDQVTVRWLRWQHIMAADLRREMERVMS